MKQSSAQRRSCQKTRSPWKGKLLLLAPPIGCSIAGAAVCEKTTSATIGDAKGARNQSGGFISGAAAGLVIGMVVAHAIRWLKRRSP